MKTGRRYWDWIPIGCVVKARPQITKNLFSDTNLSTRFSILKWALESIFAKENEILCDFRSETAKKQSEITKNSDF